MSVLAVDGGQSSVSVRYDPTPRAGIGAGSAVGSDIVLSGIGRWHDHVEAVTYAVLDTVDRLDHPAIDTVVLGLTTAPHSVADLDRLSSGVAQHTGAGRVLVADDSVTTHAAALRGAFGVSLWVGTGVACLALGPSGLRTFDGFGYLLGDDGGAFDIGRNALATVLRADMRDDGPAPTRLAVAAQDRFGPINTLPITLHDSPTAVADIAAFTIDVIELADGNDEKCCDSVALGIVSGAVDDLIGTVCAATTWIGLAVPVVVGGGVMGSAAAPSIIARMLCDRARLATPATTVAIAKTSALDGAIWLGYQSAPTPYDSHIFSWPRSPRS